MAVLAELKTIIGIDAQDVENLRALRGVVAPHFPAIADVLVRRVERSPEIRRALAASGQEANDLRATVIEWLSALFEANHDSVYAAFRLEIGQRQVQRGLPPHRMLAVLEVLRQAVDAVVAGHATALDPARERSLQKAFALDAGLLMEGYHQTHTEHVRELERDTLQAQLGEARHMAQIGQLSATLAHELRNPLAGIRGAIEVIRDTIAPDDTHYEVLGEALRQITRIDRTIKDLLVYARPRRPRHQPLDVRTLIERVQRLLMHEPALAEVRLEIKLQDGALWVEGDDIQLEQLLVNLLLNAAQASERGGYVRLRIRRTDRGVRLSVEDRGCGMDTATLERAAEPFFTTKARGTGLGLPICYKIVESHGGGLVIRSVPGKGTSVTVDLPRSLPTA